MNSAFTHHLAETKAGRLARGVRLAALACALALGAGSAWAQDHGDRRDDQGQGTQQFPRFRLPPQQRDQRGDQRPFDEPRFEQRRAPQEQREPQHDARRSSGRMTPDERRDLRRQINEAGMDLYPQRR
jgi:hypothetical protein